MACGGVKGGHVHGEATELGNAVAQDKVHIHDLRATILHQLGINPYRFS